MRQLRGLALVDQRCAEFQTSGSREECDEEPNSLPSSVTTSNLRGLSTPHEAFTTKGGLREPVPACTWSAQHGRGAGPLLGAGSCTARQERTASFAIADTYQPFVRLQGSGSTPAWRVMITLAEKKLEYTSKQCDFSKSECCTAAANRLLWALEQKFYLHAFSEAN